MLLFIFYKINLFTIIINSINVKNDDKKDILIKLLNDDLLKIKKLRKKEKNIIIFNFLLENLSKY